MRKMLKKYFIPHKENDFKPHFLRRETVLVLFIGIFLVESLFLFQSFVVFRQTNFFAAILPNALVDEANKNRTELGVRPLTINPLLEQAAKLKAEDMAKEGYFAHKDPDGRPPWYWLGKVGYDFSAAGENLAVNFLDSEDITEAWMNSSSHRSNLLNTAFTEIGIATSRGLYKGKKTTFVVQFFGRPVSVVEQAEGFPKMSAGSASNELTSAPEEEMFVEREPAMQEVLSGKAGAVAEEQSTYLQRALASPRFTLNFLYTALGVVVLVALLLKIVIDMKIQHPPLIVNGVLLLVIISSVIAANQYISLLRTGIV